MVCEKELYHMGKNNENPDLVCENIEIFHGGRFFLIFHICFGDNSFYF